jgi:hypothetical protein
VGKGVSQEEMCKRIKSLKITLMSCENTDSDDKLSDEIKWIDDKEARINEISGIISFTSEKEAGKGAYVTIYTNKRRLDFWRDLYKDKYNKGEEVFKNEFKEAMSKINDYTKSYTRYYRWSKINEKLPTGSYLACNIPINHWRLIHKNKFDDLVNNWDGI